MINIAVFASGNGSNAVNLVNAFNSGSRFRVVICLTDRENAPVMEKMARLGVPSEYFPRTVWRNEPQTILDVLCRYDVDIIALAGFLCFVDDAIVDAYSGRILNVHPSLLPAYGGKGMHGANVHKAVIKAGEKRSGATVHIVTKEVDAGPIVLQEEVEIDPSETPESLEAKVHEAEYRIFPEAVMKVGMEIRKGDSTASVVPPKDPEVDMPKTPVEEVRIDDQPETVSHPEPPAMPKSVDDAWADALGVPNNVPPMPDHAYSGIPTASAPMPERPTAFAGIPNPGNTNEPMPPTYLVWAVVCTMLCCFIPGIVAIINATKVSSRYYAGDLEGARRASRNTEIWIIVSFVLGLITATVYIPLTLAGIF